jgi:hypothetical protein
MELFHGRLVRPGATFVGVGPEGVSHDVPHRAPRRPATVWRRAAVFLSRGIDFSAG